MPGVPMLMDGSRLIEDVGTLSAVLTATLRRLQVQINAARNSYAGLIPKYPIVKRDQSSFHFYPKPLR